MSCLAAAVSPRVPLLLALTLSQAGCYSWQFTTLERQRTASHPETLHVTLTGGQQTMLLDGVALGDSLVGRAVGDPDRRVAVEMASVRDIRARRFDAGKSFFLVAGVGAVGLAIFALVDAKTCGVGGTSSC